MLKIKLNLKYCVLAFCIFLFLGYKRDAPLGQRVRGGGSDWKTLSVTAMPCHLSRKGEALARAGSLRFTGQLLLSLTNEDETCRFCQGLPLSGELSSAARLRGFSQKPPSPSRLCRATSPERERLWQRRKVYGLQVGFFCLLCQVLALEGKDLPQPETKRGKESGTHPLQPVLYFPEASGPALCAKKLAGEDSPAV